MNKTDSLLKRGGRALELALYVVAGATVLAMMVYVVANALSRTLFRFPFPASLEIVQYLMMPGIASLGFIAATIARRHVVAELFFDRFPAIGRKWLVFTNSVIAILALGVLVWFTWEHAVFAFARGFNAGFTQIPSWPFYFAVSISLFICALLFARDAWVQARIAAGDTEVAESTSPLDEDLTPEQKKLIAQARATGEVL